MTQSIMFELPTDIAYVAGTVNDVDKCEIISFPII